MLSVCGSVLPSSRTFQSVCAIGIEQQFNQQVLREVGGWKHTSNTGAEDTTSTVLEISQCGNAPYGARVNRGRVSWIEQHQYTRLVRCCWGRFDQHCAERPVCSDGRWSCLRGVTVVNRPPRVNIVAGGIHKIPSNNSFIGRFSPPSPDDCQMFSPVRNGNFARSIATSPSALVHAIIVYRISSIVASIHRGQRPNVSTGIMWPQR